ncbi:MAG: YraN family protein [Roseiflexaceae bacterium]|nr:YraN family protein [Roseiflexaceae bacterium]
MQDQRRKLGSFGEAVALAHLTRAGLNEVARNWRGRGGEIDLIMRDGTTLVFVEVRTRRDGSAAESVGARKQSKLVALAYTYLAQHCDEQELEWRIDVVAIQLGRGGQVQHLDWVRDAVEQ